MSRWFRHYAGMMRDEKLVSAAVRSKQPIERIVWIWGAILESAAEINDNGKFSLDTAEVAYFLRAEQADLDRIVSTLEELGRIAGDSVVKWGDRQFSSDRSADRTRAYRERQKGPPDEDHNVTQSGDAVTIEHRDCDVTSPQRHSDAPETELETETEKEKKEAIGSRKRRTYSAVFENDFWNPYPRTPIMSKAEAWREWQKLTEPDRSAAIAAIPRFITFLKSKPGHPAVHACRFLKQRRFDGFGEAEAANVVALKGFYAPAESQQLTAWDAFKKATEGKTYPRDSRGGWLVPAEWPPDYQATQQEAMR
jgi:hypothetical protein